MTTSKKLSDSKKVTAIELNVSCPNVKDGIQFGSNEDSLERLTAAVKEANRYSFICKAFTECN